MKVRLTTGKFSKRKIVKEIGICAKAPVVEVEENCGCVGDSKLSPNTFHITDLTLAGPCGIYQTQALPEEIPFCGCPTCL